MSKKLLYLFGEPGTGKITVARILQERLGWRLFWLHDLDSVCAIVGRYPLPRLMDRISLAVLEELMDAEDDIIYVRPSRDGETVAKVLKLAGEFGYRSFPIRLWAERATQVARVSARERSPFRVASEGGLNKYLTARPSTQCLGLPADLNLSRISVSTDRKSPEQVADEIQSLMEEAHERVCSHAGT